MIKPKNIKALVLDDIATTVNVMLVMFLLFSVLVGILEFYAIVKYWHKIEAQHIIVLSVLGITDMLFVPYAVVVLGLKLVEKIRGE